MKKIISLATIFTIVAMVAGPGAASAATAAELQAQINALLAQLQTLQSQLGAMGGGTGAVPVACAGITAFNTNLTVGSTGNDVKCLQALLNQSADTQVATTGAGSPGSETTYFGSLTQAAVSKYQAKNGISPTAGYFGPITRAKLNTTLASGTPGTPGTPVIPGTCNGTEGSYTVVLSASPVSRTVNAGAGLEAYGIDVTARGSDITIGRVDLQAAVVANAVTQSPNTLITGIKVYKDSVSDANLLASFPSPVFNQDTSSLYYTSLTGLNAKVLKDTTVKLLITLDVTTSIDISRVITLNVYGNNGIRGVDCSGINTFAALATTRVLTAQQPGNATLTITTASDNPVSQYFKQDPTNGVQTKETVLSLNAKATSGDAKLRRMELTYASTASEAVPSIVYLYDGDTLVTSGTPNASENGVVTFENFTLPISQDVTKNLKVKADWGLQNTGTNDFTPTVPATSARCVFERANGSLANATITAITGNTMFVQETGLKLSFVSGSAVYAAAGQTAGIGTATGTLVFKAKPFGGALVEFAYATGATGTTDVSAVRVEAISISSPGQEAFASGTAVSVNRSLQSSIVGRSVSEDEEVTVTTTYNLGTGSGMESLAGNWKFKIENLMYSVGGTAACIGSGPTAGNLFDTWQTNIIYMMP